MNSLQETFLVGTENTQASKMNFPLDICEDKKRLRMCCNKEMFAVVFHAGQALMHATDSCPTRTADCFGQRLPLLLTSALNVEGRPGPYTL